MEWSASTCSSFGGAPPELAFGGDDHRCGGDDDYAGEDEESCRVRRRHHVIGQLADAASKLAWKIATNNTL